MNEYWLATTEGHIRLSDICQLYVMNIGKYFLKAETKDTRTYTICSNHDKDPLFAILKEIITGNSKLLFKFESASEKNIIKELCDKVDELTEMIKYMPGGPVFLQARSHFVENSVASTTTANSSVSTDLNQIDKNKN